MSRRFALVLFLARLMRKPLPMSMKSLLPVMAAKRLPPICSKIVFAIMLFLVLGWRCGHRQLVQHSVISAMGVFRFNHSIRHSILYSLVMTAVWRSMAVNLLLYTSIHPFRVSTPHASASSKMPSNTLIGSLNFTISVW